MEVYQQGRFKSAKTGVSSYLKVLASPETKSVVCFLRGNVYIRKIRSVKLSAFGLKISSFPWLLVGFVSQICLIYFGKVAGI